MPYPNPHRVSTQPPLFPSPNARLGRALPFLLFFLLVLAVYADPLFSHRNFAGRDLLGYHLPMEKAVHDAYRRGRLPVWMPEISGGRPLLANPNIGAFYPLRPLLALLPFPLAVRIHPLLHWVLAGAGTIVLLRSIGASRPAAWVAAVTYAFSGVSISEVFYTNLLPGLMLLPWIVWCVQRPAASGARKALGLSLLYALLFLSGDVFLAGVALLCSLLWVALETDVAERRAALVWLAAAVVLAVLLAAPQIVATALWIGETHRGVTGMKLAEAVRYSLSPFRLLELLVPYFFGPTWAAEPKATWAMPVFGSLVIGFFATLYSGAFASMALLAAGRLRATGARFARVLFGVGLAISVLPGFLPSRWSLLTSPVPLRYPEKFAVVLVLAMAILSGLAFDSFRRSPGRMHWRIGVGAWLALAAAAAVSFPRSTGQIAVRIVGADLSFAEAAAEHLPGALAEAGLLWMTAVLCLEVLRRSSRAAVVLALALITVCPIAANRRIARTFRQEDVLAPTAFARAIERLDPSGNYRALGESPYIAPSRFENMQLGSDVGFTEFARRSWLYYTQALWNRGTVFNYDFDAGDLSRVESLRKLSARADEFAHPEAFFAGVSLRFGIRFPDQTPVPGFRRFGGNFLQDWDENPEALPDIRLIQNWRETPGSLAALAELPGLTRGEVVLETGTRRRGSARPGQVRIVERSPERLRLETDCSDPGWLFVLRAFWTYRSVLLDGRPVSVVPAQLAFSAMAVPAGRHRIDWREEVPGGEVSRWGPVLFGLVAAAALLRERRRSDSQSGGPGGESR